MTIQAHVVVLVAAAACGCRSHGDKSEAKPPEPRVQDSNEMTTEEQKAECEKLMNSLTPFAIDMLKNHGEFYPFGGAVSMDGEIAQQGAYDGNEFPERREIFELLAKGLRSEAEKGAIRASAIVSDVTVTLPNSPAKQDAIRISLEHRGGYSAEVLLPYRIAPDKSVELGEMYAVEGERNVFAKKEDAIPLDRTKHGATAIRFANALVAGKYDEAHKMLHPSLQRELTAAKLQQHFVDMIDYGDGPPDHVELMNDLTDWPTKEPGDIGWAYVAISGPGYSEAVAVVVTNDSLIREIEWGRP